MRFSGATDYYSAAPPLAWLADFPRRWRGPGRERVRDCYFGKEKGGFGGARQKKGGESDPAAGSPPNKLRVPILVIAFGE